MATRLTVATEPRYFRSASFQARALGFGLRHTVRPTLALWAHLPFDLYPPNLLDLVAKFLPLPEGTRYHNVRLENCNADWVAGGGVDAEFGATDRAIVYFHGGAFVTCGLNTHRRMVSRISAAAGQPVLNVAYRQMPGSSITSSIEDGIDAFRWLVSRGYRPENITIAGDSAGGYMAFAIARGVIDAGWGTPAGVVAISPLLDLENEAKRRHRNADRCQTFPMSAMERFTVIAKRRERRDGIADRPCPVNMDVDDLPASLIQVGSLEILRADAEIMANRLTAAGLPCDLQIWDRQVHVFQAAASWVPEARRAIDEIALFVRNLETAAAAPARSRKRGA
jgi:acetyl esterase/lipase